MRLKKELCQNWKVYVIADRQAAGNRSLQDLVKSAIFGGANVIQLRDKNSSDREMVKDAINLLKITRASQVPLIINDRIDVAAEVQAEGVHLGQEDGNYIFARKALGRNAIIGRSTHSPEQALKAQNDGFDYIGVGPVFTTPTKPSYTAVGLDLVRFATSNIQIPFVAIGGIDEKNALEIKSAGARTVAVVRAVMSANDPKLATENLCKIML